MKRRDVFLCVTLMPLLGCSQARYYTGDGTFTDNGFLAYSRRYEIDLGAVNLSTPGTYAYKLSGLPHAEMNVGIRVFEATKNERDVTPDYPATVRIELRTAQGETVISEQGSLNTWTRSYGAGLNYSDLYVQGEGRDIPLSGGNTRGERVGVKASGGWGTYFDSERDKTYLLNLAVLSTAPSMVRPARLMVAGWDR
jgi:hypothetical protein